MTPKKIYTHIDKAFDHAHALLMHLFLTVILICVLWFFINVVPVMIEAWHNMKR